MPLDEWITPAEAAQEMGRIAGYKVLPRDIQQLRRTGKLKQFRRLSDRITLYSLEEVRSIKPVNKRNKEMLTQDAA